MKSPIPNLSLLWRILLSTSIAITILFAAMGWILQDQFLRLASFGFQEEVRAGFQAYDSLWKARADQLASVGQVLSRMPDVRAAFGTGDPPSTILPPKSGTKSLNPERCSWSPTPADESSPPLDLSPAARS